MSIGLLNEGPLHASLKALYVEPGDETEVRVDGYVVDIHRGDLIVEIQTGNFSRAARKIRDLVTRHRVKLVYPVPSDLWIVKMPPTPGDAVTRRKSPKHPGVIDVFAELVSFPELISHENFQIEVLLTEEEVVWESQPGKRWRRRGWVTVERRLLKVRETVSLRNSADYMSMVPDGLPAEFQTSDLATHLGRPRHLAQKMAYCLAKGGLICRVGSKGNSILYAKVSEDPSSKPARRRQPVRGRAAGVAHPARGRELRRAPIVTKANRPRAAM